MRLAVGVLVWAACVSAGAQNVPTTPPEKKPQKPTHPAPRPATPTTGKEQVPQKHYPVLDVTLMDKSIDPCVDFYAYSCGNWIKQNPIPPDKSSWSVFAQMADRSLEMLRDILQQAALPRPGRSAVDQKIGDYYSACMNEKNIDTAGATPLQSLFRKIDAAKSKADVAELIVTMQGLEQLGPSRQPVLFSFTSDQDFKRRHPSHRRS
jgi:endothelin-converting enzyme/putative endopeptidase